MIKQVLAGVAAIGTVSGAALAQTYIFMCLRLPLSFLRRWSPPERLRRAPVRTSGNDHPEGGR
jgi:hypothetical protein